MNSISIINLFFSVVFCFGFQLIYLFVCPKRICDICCVLAAGSIWVWKWFCLCGRCVFLLLYSVCNDGDNDDNDYDG